MPDLGMLPARLYDHPAKLVIAREITKRRVATHMAEGAERNVALFIDWDNLAISVAADMGGSTPDVKRIVHKAQEYGRVIVARAYAEWNTMSERLAVYRAGVEPVYAPTFRFETDPVTQVSRGKSLADPVMVADCIDTLHTLPQISVYVLVSGDKDLIPVVRLAQLRGRQVVVIGPDFVAAVLKDMADDFISYRTLVYGETLEAVAPPQAPRPRDYGTMPPRRQPAPPRGHQAGRTAPSMTPQRPPVAPPAPAPEAEAKVAEAVPEPPELSSIFSTIVGILQHMASTGRIRVRATNIKDQLLVRVPGFSERRYGFTKFKDLLVAAERNGLLKVNAAGPVHWVSLPEAKVEEPTLREVPETPAVVVVPPEEKPAATVGLEAGSRERQLAVISFVDGLRQRSRWLTYTYVLTNVIGFIGRLVPPSVAETESRNILNYLVAEGALRIDKVPQEVDVGGIKHRVRMCHFVDDHELVREARSSQFEWLPEDLKPELRSPEPEAQPGREAVASVDPELGAERPVTSGEPSLELVPPVAEATVTESPGNGRLADEDQESVSEGESAEEAPSRPRPRRPRRRGRGGQAERAQQAEAESAVEVAPEGAAEAAPVAAVPQEEALVPQSAEAEQSPAEASPPSLEEVFVRAKQILAELAQQGKARVTGSSLKLRLSRAFGRFDERRYGFSKFKDFLLAAERAGHVVVDVEGQVNWVRIPSEETEAGAPEAPPEAQPDQMAEAEPVTATPSVLEAAEGQAAAEGEAVPSTGGDEAQEAAAVPAEAEVPGHEAEGNPVITVGEVVEEPTEAIEEQNGE
jgi:uncharacterized LabA/DUF88 family protein